MQTEELLKWCQQQRRSLPDQLAVYHEGQWAGIENFDRSPDATIVIEAANYVADLGDTDFAKHILAEFESLNQQPLALLMEIEAWCSRQRMTFHNSWGSRFLDDSRFEYSISDAARISARSLGNSSDEAERDFILTANSQILKVARKLGLCTPDEKTWEAARLLTTFLAGETDRPYSVVEKLSVASVIQEARLVASTRPDVEMALTLPMIKVEITGPKKDSGAFGQIFPGRQTHLGRDVAIKVIQQSAKPNAVEHAKGLAKVSHPNVVAVFDVGSIRLSSTGQIVDCVVMEWLAGKKLCECRNELSRNSVVPIFEQIRSGLEAMHQAGVSHHDLHAGNVMIDGESAKIIDVQYTESAQFSRLASGAIQSLIDEDYSAFARLVRDTLWHMGVCAPETTERLLKTTCLDEIMSILRESLRI